MTDRTSTLAETTGQHEAPVAPPRTIAGLPLLAVRVVLLALFFVATFSACYVGAFHSSPPRHVPVGVTGDSPLRSGPALRVTRYPDAAALTRAVEHGTVVGGIAAGPQPAVLIGLAQGKAATQFAQTTLTRAAPGAEVRLLAPYGRGDPNGILAFFVSLSLLVPSIIVGTLLGISKTASTRVRLATLVGYAALAAVVNWLIVGRWLGALTGPSWQYATVVGCYALAVAATCAGLAAWAVQWVALAGIVFLGLGIPATGGPAGLTYFVPQLFQDLRDVVPPSVAVQGMRATEYFGGSGLWQACLTLIGWTVLGGLALAGESLRRKRRHHGRHLGTDY
ncbi:MAG TPA: hypothetical protein VMB79_07695 [Jatrophihabitans sp.]|nr:hypothetical protein [Jatrophihabitans sp.]